MIHYTCMHCGKVANLPDDKRETVYTCPACQFSNWVSGMAVAELEQPSPRFRQEAPPPARPAAGQTQAPRPAMGHPAPRRTAAGASPSRMPQAYPAPKVAPPPPPPSIQTPPKAPTGQTPPPAKTPPPGQPGAARPKPLSGLEQNLELLQRDLSHTAKPPEYHPRPTPPETPRSEICPEAIGAFLLGLLSVLSLVSPIIPLTVIVSLVTLGLSAKAKTKIDAEPARLRGAGLTSIAALLGVMGLIGSVLVRGCVR